MNNKTKSILTVITLVLVLLVGIPIIISCALPAQESVQSIIANYGVWGYIFYVFFGITAVVIVPLNFSLTGLAGGFVYGTWIAFLTNWLCKIIGTFIAFLLGKYFGKIIIPYLKKKQYLTLDRILESNQIVLIYFILNFIPFTPSDAIAYFLGFSKMKARVFLPISIISSAGTSFALAYIGSGEAINNPLFLIVLGLILSSGLFWLHQTRQKAKLK